MEAWLRFVCFIVVPLFGCGCCGLGFGENLTDQPTSRGFSVYLYVFLSVRLFFAGPCPFSFSSLIASEKRAPVCSKILLPLEHVGKMPPCFDALQYRTRHFVIVLSTVAYIDEPLQSRLRYNKHLVPESRGMRYVSEYNIIVVALL